MMLNQKTLVHQTMEIYLQQQIQDTQFGQQPIVIKMEKPMSLKLQMEPYIQILVIIQQHQQVVILFMLRGLY